MIAAIRSFAPSASEYYLSMGSMVQSSSIVLNGVLKVTTTVVGSEEIRDVRV